jgi:hypothetical protein
VTAQSFELPVSLGSLWGCFGVVGNCPGFDRIWIGKQEGNTSSVIILIVLSKEVIQKVPICFTETLVQVRGVRRNSAGVDHVWGWRQKNRDVKHKPAGRHKRGNPAIALPSRGHFPEGSRILNLERLGATRRLRFISSSGKLVLIVYPPIRFGSVDNNVPVEKEGSACDSPGAAGIE